MRRLHKVAHHAAHRSSEMRALYVLLFVIILRARRRIRAWRPRQMAIPAAILQIVVFGLAALTEHFIFGFAIGNFIIAAFLMLPVMLQTDEVKVHWVRPQE